MGRSPIISVENVLDKGSARVQEMVESSPSYWEDYFNIAFKKIKVRFSEIYLAEEASELPPTILGMKSAHSAYGKINSSWKRSI